MLMMTTFCFRSNGALASGLEAREAILAGTMRSSKPCMIRMSRRFSSFQHMGLQHITLRACINCGAIYCGMRGRISLSVVDVTRLIVSEHAGVCESTNDPLPSMPAPQPYPPPQRVGQKKALLVR